MTTRAAESLSKGGSFRRCILVAAAMLTGFAAHAQTFDPTRPAPQWLAAHAAPGAAAALQRGANAPDETGDRAQGIDAARDLRVVVVGPTRRIAVIGGRVVRQGEQFSGGRLIGVSANGVIVQNDGESSKIDMSPAVKKTARAPASPTGKNDEKRKSERSRP
jgi:hypothetical protein